MCKITDEKLNLFKKIKISLGAPIRKIELTDEQLCELLEMSIEDYAEIVQNWLIENQWPSLYGKSLSNTDIAFAITVRSNDYESQFAYAYSKAVGLQSRGPWELKKDYITIESGKQVYEIPAGREINEVLYLTPPTTDHALLAYYGGFDFGFGGGFSQVGAGFANAGGGYGYGGMGGYYIAPAYDVLLTAQDFNLKNRLLRSDLTYKITAGPNGTRLLHLLSTPGSPITFGNGVTDGGLSPVGGRTAISLQGCRVWYHYYETTPENVDACRKENPDIIKLPNEVPLSKIKYEDLNEPTKILVRKILLAKAKLTLGRIRGKFGGVVGPPEAERTMDYSSLLDEGKEEYNNVIDEIRQRLERMSNLKMLERKSQEAEYLNNSLKYRPLGIYFK